MLKKNTALELSSAVAGQAHSPEHKRFHTLMAKIATVRERLAAWHSQAPIYAVAHQARVVPQLQALNSARRAWAFELEALLAALKWSKPDAATLSAMICNFAGALLDQAEDEPPTDAQAQAAFDELKALYNRHSDTDYDTEHQQHVNEVKAAVEGLESLFEEVRPASGKGPRGAAPPEPAEPDLFGDAQPEPTEHRPRPRQTAAQKRAQADAARISQTVREVFRKLASALHPDRMAPGTPQAERDARTTQMQRANSAYEAGNLLALLELQLEIEQVSTTQVATMANEQVRHFNKVLAGQLKELEAEVMEREAMFCMAYGHVPEKRINPQELDKFIKEEVQELQSLQMMLEHDRRLLQRDPLGARRFLKQWREELRGAERGVAFF